jgi:hypothetical protein
MTNCHVYHMFIFLSVLIICITTLFHAVLFYQNKYKLRADIEDLRKQVLDIQGKQRVLSDKLTMLNGT